MKVCYTALFGNYEELKEPQLLPVREELSYIAELKRGPLYSFFQIVPGDHER